VKVPDTQKWIADNFFIKANPLEAVIVTYRIGKNNYGRDESIVGFDNGTHIREMSVFGDNVERLILAFGDDSDKWIGKKVRLSQTVENGKKVRYVLP